MKARTGAIILSAIVLSELISALSWSYAGGSGTVEEMTPRQVLEQYRAVREVGKRQFSKTEELNEFVDNLGRTEILRCQYEYAGDNRRFDLTIDRQTMEVGDEGTPVLSGDPTRQQAIWDSQGYIQVDQRNAGISAVLSSSKDGNAYFVVNYGGVCLDGILYGDQEPVDVVLKNAADINIRPSRENVNGYPCYVIDAVCPGGKYTLWIDPEHGYNLARAEIKKKDTDSFYGGTASVVFDDFGGKPLTKMPKQRDSIDIVLKDIEFGKVDGKWIPLSATNEAIRKYDTGQVTETHRQRLKRIQMVFNPDFDAIGAFVPHIPDGTPVEILEAQGIKYVWRNGKPVKM